MISAIRAFLQEEDGPTAVEYAVLVGLIIIASIGMITAFGGAINTFFKNASSQIPSGTAVP
jgi:pilus assembly protein Flp/PilA